MSADMSFSIYNNTGKWSAVKKFTLTIVYPATHYRYC